MLDVAGAATFVAPRNQFLAQDRHPGWSVDPETNLVSVELYDGDPNIASDHDLLQLLPGQNQHPSLLAVRLM
jgi:hypothetical protein